MSSRLHRRRPLAPSAPRAEGPDGARLHLTGPRDGKVHVSGCYPVTSLRVTSCGINVGAGRPPAVIAAEIGRRLLPGYRAALAEIREH